MLEKGLCGEELAQELISVLSVNYSIATNQLTACMRDQSAVNSTAVRIMKIAYPQLIDIGCFPYIIDHVGEHFVAPNLSEFVSNWISPFLIAPRQR